jgi:signal transduction histidine kinase
MRYIAPGSATGGVTSARRDSSGQVVEKYRGRWTLAAKVWALFALSSIAVVGTMLALSMRTQQQVVAELTDDLHSVVRTVHFATRRLTGSNGRDAQALERFVQEAQRRNKAIERIWVVNRNQVVVASSDPALIGMPMAFSLQDSIARERFSTTDSVDWYDVSIPIIQDKEVIGQVHASVAAYDIREGVQRLYLQNVLVASVVLLTLFAVLSVAIQRLGRSLAGLSDAARRVAHGEWGTRIDIAGRDEVAAAIESFNAMSEQLSKQRSTEERLRVLERKAMLAETAAVLAHEIRNPLNLINLTADHASAQFAPSDGKRREEYLRLLGNLKAQVKHLNSMVQEFLTVGKPVRPFPRAFLFRELVEEVHVLVRQQAMAKGIRMETEIPPDLTMCADRDQMRLVLLNLILNALAASGSGVVMVRATMAGTATIAEVLDDGLGIAPEHIEKVFEPYFMKKPDGTGLGLTLVRRIVEEHGGTVCAENRPNGGARMWFRLPAKENAGGASTDS